MTIITTVTEYKPFADHDKEAQAKILDRYRYYDVEHVDWYDAEIDYFKDALELIGFYDIKIGFSGFCSQGDGASFTGYYSYEKGAAKKVKAEFPQWSELHLLADQLQSIAKKHFYQLNFELFNATHFYAHENTVDIKIISAGSSFQPFSDHEFDILECCRDFMRHIYKTLEKEYDYLTSDAHLIELFTECATDYEFDENGKML